jgi:spore germination protein KB
METKKTIYTRQFIWLLFILFTSFSVVATPGVLISLAQRDCWLSVIFAWTLDVIFGTVYAYMGVRFPDQNLVQHSITIWGKYLGKLPGIILVLFFSTFCCILQFSVSLVINKMLLPRTPTQVILGISLTVAAYSAKKGLRVLGRACELLGPLFFISLITLTIFIIPKFKLGNLKPQLHSGFLPIASGTYFILSYLGICIMMTMYIPLNDKVENGFFAKVIASSLGSFIILLFVVSIIGIFGIKQAKEMFYPGFELARMIEWENFFERVESIWIVITITASIISSSTLIWASSVGISQLTGIKDNKPLINSVTMLLFIISSTSFANGIELGNFSLYVYPLFAPIITMFEILLWLTALITKKKTN